MNLRLLILLSFLFVVYACDNSSGTDPMPDPLPALELDLSNCPLDVSSETLDVLTWNLEQFPKNGLTKATVEDIIEYYNPDLIALQEITSVSQFNDLLQSLEGWEGFARPFNGSNLMLGYLYKSSEVELLNSTILFEEQTDMNDDAFTAFRRPLKVQINHKPSGLNVELINIHLKCCNGHEDRRRAATTLLKGYIDTELPQSNVVVLGDFNDDIIDNDNVFQAWLDDDEHYYFTTLPVAQGPSTGWSYPSFPSQIDNILISDELFDNEVNSGVLTLDNCFSNFAEYEVFVSDHRPAFLHLR